MQINIYKKMFICIKQRTTSLISLYKPTTQEADEYIVEVYTFLKIIGWLWFGAYCLMNKVVKEVVHKKILCQYHYKKVTSPLKIKKVCFNKIVPN